MVVSNSATTTTAFAGKGNEDGGANQWAIGIDLGTTYSCVGVFRNDKVEIIANDLGNRTTPSYVAFTDQERLVGEGAKNQCQTNPKNTVFDVKRLIGRRFSDQGVQEDIARFPFAVVGNDNDEPILKVDYLSEPRRFSPQEISSMVLEKMKRIAEQYLGGPVTKAVVTVPAYFTDSQRQATKEAGAIAGLEVLRILNEPTAAALAYGLEKGKMADTNVLIFDLGGGTFDVTVLKIDNDVYEVKATAGNTRLGGEDFDDRLVAYAAKEFERKTGFGVRSARALRRLRTACESAKRALSSQNMATIEVEALEQGEDLMLKITRARFESLCVDLFDRCIHCVDLAVKDSGISRQEMHDVVLVGGSSRIPMIQEKLQAFFEGKPLRQTINPDEAVAYGAAVQAYLILNRQTGRASSASTSDIVLLDVTPLSLGVRTRGEMMNVLIPRNCTIPEKVSRMYSTAEDHQDEIKIQVYEGERAMCQDNNLLGEFSLAGLPRMKAGTPRIEVVFSIDVDGILLVSAEEKRSRTRAQIVIQQERGRIGKDQVQRMIEDAEKYREQDRLAARRAEALNRLEQYAHTVAAFASNPEVRTPDLVAELDLLLAATADCDEWISDSSSKATYEEIDDRMHDLEETCDPVMNRVYAQQDRRDAAPPSTGTEEEDEEDFAARVAQVLEKDAVAPYSSVRRTQGP